VFSKFYDIKSDKTKFKTEGPAGNPVLQKDSVKHWNQFMCLSLNEAALNKAFTVYTYSHIVCGPECTGPHGLTE